MTRTIELSDDEMRSIIDALRAHAEQLEWDAHNGADDPRWCATEAAFCLQLSRKVEHFLPRR